MNIQESWEKALRRTEIIRPRVQPLQTFSVTHVSYVFLGESLANQGDTVTRRGEVIVEKPSIVLPRNMPHFEGFNLEEEMHLSEDLLKSFFLVRGVSFPSLKYNNKTESVELFEGDLSKAVQHYGELLARSEDVHTGLLTGPADCWQFSVLIFVCGQVARSANNDIQSLFDKFHRGER